MVLEAAAKVVVYAALLPMIGVATAYWLVAPRALPRDSPERPAVVDALRRLGLSMSLVALAGLALRAWAHTAAVFGVGESLSPRALATVALESRWAAGWQAQVLAALGFGGAYWSATANRTLPWRLVATFVVFSAVAATMTGHAAGAVGRMAVQAAHLLGAGAWLGTLAALVVIRPSLDRAVADALFRAFSTVALAGAAILLSCGVVAAALYVGTFANLWTTTYGRLVILKAGCFAGVAACGYVNWRRTRSARPPAAAALELAFAALAIVLTAILTETEHP